MTQHGHPELLIGSVHQIDYEVAKVFPCLVKPARYGGTYSGGQWHAWPVKTTQMIPGEAYGSDIVCGEFWSEQRETGVPVVGTGQTPDEAHSRLIETLAEMDRITDNKDRDKPDPRDVRGLRCYLKNLK